MLAEMEEELRKVEQEYKDGKTFSRTRPEALSSV